MEETNPIEATNEAPPRREKIPPPPEPAKGLAAIRSLVAKPITISFTFNGTPCELEGRYLLPTEFEMVRLMIDELGTPPLVKGAKPSDPGFDAMASYDWMNVEYMAKKTKLERKLRALTLFWTVPEIRNQCADAEPKQDMYAPRVHGKILDFIHNDLGLTEEVLDQIYSQVRQNPVSVAERVNFS